MLLYVLSGVRPTDATYINISVASTLEGLIGFCRRKFSSGGCLFRLPVPTWFPPNRYVYLRATRGVIWVGGFGVRTRRWLSQVTMGLQCPGVLALLWEFWCQICRHAIRRNLTVCCGSSGLQRRLPLRMWLLLTWRSKSDWGGYFLKPHAEIRIIAL